jgi:hypothetical protein
MYPECHTKLRQGQHEVFKTSITPDASKRAADGSKDVEPPRHKDARAAEQSTGHRHVVIVGFLAPWRLGG